MSDQCCVTEYVFDSLWQLFSDGVTDYVIALSPNVSMSLMVSLTVVFVCVDWRTFRPRSRS